MANTNSIMYGYKSLDILLFNREVSSYRNKLDRRVPKQDINPRNGLFNPKNSRV